MSAIADAARPLLDGYLEQENWAALRAAVEAEEAAIRAVAAGHGEFTDGTPVVLPAEDWSRITWLLDALARDLQLTAVSRRRAAVLCDRIGRQTRPDVAAVVAGHTAPVVARLHEAEVPA